MEALLMFSEVPGASSSFSTGFNSGVPFTDCWSSGADSETGSSEPSERHTSDLNFEDRGMNLFLLQGVKTVVSESVSSHFRFFGEYKPSVAPGSSGFEA